MEHHCKIASSLAELNSLVDIKDILRGKNVAMIVNAAVKLFNQAKDCNERGDMELAYVSFMKYFQCYKYIANSKDYLKNKVFYDKIIGQKQLESLSKAEELSIKLQKIYEIKPNSQTNLSNLMKPFPAPSNELDIQSMDENEFYKIIDNYNTTLITNYFDKVKYIEAKDLISYLKLPSNLFEDEDNGDFNFQNLRLYCIIIFITKSAESFPKLNYPYAITIPYHLLEFDFDEKLFYKWVNAKLDLQSLEIWNHLSNFDTIVFIDSDGSGHLISDGKDVSNFYLSPLLDIITPLKRAKQPIYYLRGGWKALLKEYPAYIDNQNLNNRITVGAGHNIDKNLVVNDPDKNVTQPISNDRPKNVNMNGSKVRDKTEPGYVIEEDVVSYKPNIKSSMSDLSNNIKPIYPTATTLNKIDFPYQKVTRKPNNDVDEIADTQLSTNGRKFDSESRNLNYRLHLKTKSQLLPKPRNHDLGNIDAKLHTKDYPANRLPLTTIESSTTNLQIPKSHYASKYSPLDLSEVMASLPPLLHLRGRGPLSFMPHSQANQLAGGGRPTKPTSSRSELAHWLAEPPNALINVLHKTRSNPNLKGECHSLVLPDSLNATTDDFEDTTIMLSNSISPKPLNNLNISYLATCTPASLEESDYLAKYQQRPAPPQIDRSLKPPSLTSISIEDTNSESQLEDSSDVSTLEMFPHSRALIGRSVDTGSSKSYGSPSLNYSSLKGGTNRDDKLQNKYGRYVNNPSKSHHPMNTPDEEPYRLQYQGYPPVSCLSGQYHIIPNPSMYSNSPMAMPSMPNSTIIRAARDLIGRPIPLSNYSSTSNYTDDTSPINIPDHQFYSLSSADVTIDSLNSPYSISGGSTTLSPNNTPSSSNIINNSNNPETINYDQNFPLEVVQTRSNSGAPSKPFNTSEYNLPSQMFGLTGILNTGNSCFINSILQCLSYTIPLAEYFVNKNYLRDLNLKRTRKSGAMLNDSSNYQNRSLSAEFAGVCRALWKAQYPSINPISFSNAISQYAPIIEIGTQQDSHELLTFLIDGLHEDLNRCCSSTPTSTSTNKSNYLTGARSSDTDSNQENEPVEALAQRAWDNYKRSNDSIIVDLMSGQLKSVVQCQRCQKESTTFDTFQGLSLPLPSNGKCTLQDCIRAFLSPEPINDWKCPKCNKRTKAQKKLYLWKIPPILIIHLMRFKNDGQNHKKIMTTVEFPINGLDLTYYCSANYDDKYLYQILPEYSLYAVSNHYGTLESGHYTAFCRNPVNEGNWYKFDDQHIGRIDTSDIRTPAAYILFYSSFPLKPPNFITS